MSRTIRLQPISGKFLQTDVRGKQINIWLVDPKTNQQGTEVGYEDAIAILAFNHPVATLAAIKGKDGKFINQLTDEDKEKIAKLKEEGLNSTNTSMAAPSSHNNLEELVKAQSKLLETQGELIKQMKSEIDDIKKDKKAKEETKQAKAK